MALLCALNLAVLTLLSLAVVVLYLDGRGAKRALLTWQGIVERRLDHQGARLVGHGARLATVERASRLPAEPVPPPAPLPPSPGALLLEQETLTRDDHPNPTRPTVEAPPPADQDDGSTEEEVAAALRALHGRPVP